MITPPPASIEYTNWAGYEWNGGTTSAAAFTVPEFPYHDMSAAEKANRTVMPIWAGLSRGPYIEQIGIYDYVQAGQVKWAGFCAWWPTVDIGCGHGISTGDHMSVSVHRSGLTYKMSMHDAGPHNVWTISISKTLNHADTTAEAIVEDTQYPGDPYQPLTYFNPVKFTTSGNPATEVYSPWAFAVKNSSRSFTVKHR